MSVYFCEYIYLNKYIYIYIYIYMSVSIYINIYTNKCVFLFGSVAYQLMLFI